MHLASSRSISIAPCRSWPRATRRERCRTSTGAIELSASASSDSASWYLGESDFDIGRLADLHPGQANVLLGVQRRLREAQVAVRVLGSARVTAGQPSLGAVTVTAARVKPYAGDQIIEGTPIEDGAHVATTDLSGVRIRADGLSSMKGRNLSARIWLDALPRPEYATDVTVSDDTMSVDLISPYGRAGYYLDPGTYRLEIYVDGSWGYGLSWTVDPRPDKPAYSTVATPFLDTIRDAGFGCGDATTQDARSTVNCSLNDSANSTYYVDLTFDDRDRITYVVLGVTTDPTGSVDVNMAGHQFFDNVVRLLYPADLAGRITSWIDQTGTAVDDIDVGATTVRVYGADATTRNLDIWSPWP